MITRKKNEKLKRKGVDKAELEPSKKEQKKDHGKSESEDAPSDKKTQSQILPRPKSKLASQVEDLKRAIRKKEDWKYKFQDPVIKGRYIDEALAQGASKEAIDVAIQELECFEMKETLFNFDDVVSNHSIFHVDGLIPESLQNSLESHLDALANAPNKDWHPGSEDKVLDLIHPSLFPYIKGVSLTYEDLKKPPQKQPEKEKKEDKPKKKKKKEEEKKPVGSRTTQPAKKKAKDEKSDGDSKDEGQKGEDDDSDELKERFNPWHRDINSYHKEKDRWGRPIENSKYQWLPAIYSVDAKNRVKITSYINNLDRSEHPEIYTDCENIFEKLLPTIDACIEKSQISFKEYIGTHYGNRPEPIKLKGPRTYQVITKACNYVLKPKESYEGNWHIEGMTHERILVSALYYYSTSPHIDDAGLSFRAETGYSDEYGNGERSWKGSEDLGTLRTNQGRCIVFSNEFQHCVTCIENTSKTKTANRKILCFFVVDPQNPIVSSNEVPPQQWEKMKKKLLINLLLVLKRLRVTVPKDVLLKIADYAKIGFTWEEALEHRKKLMKERKYFTDYMNVTMEREYSLCEH